MLDSLYPKVFFHNLGIQYLLRASTSPLPFLWVALLKKLWLRDAECLPIPIHIRYCQLPC